MGAERNRGKDIESDGDLESEYERQQMQGKQNVKQGARRADRGRLRMREEGDQTTCVT